MTATRYWGVVPAAGVGSRMGRATPKQYLTLRGELVIDHSLQRLLAVDGVERVVVALSAEDRWWPQTRHAHHPRVTQTPGGRERYHSVLNGLKALEGIAADADWVLVHDAARPCVRSADIRTLLERIADHPCGGLLAKPVHDTMKRADAAGQITATVDRDGLWHAFTPQAFRYAALRGALAAAMDAGVPVTDEASAMEYAGHAPLLVEGAADNLKITRPADLALAGFFIDRQSAS